VAKPLTIKYFRPELQRGTLIQDTRKWWVGGRGYILYEETLLIARRLGFWYKLKLAQNDDSDIAACRRRAVEE